MLVLADTIEACSAVRRKGRWQPSSVKTVQAGIFRSVMGQDAALADMNAVGHVAALVGMAWDDPRSCNCWLGM